jgi:AcrR family transcriptional regulator
VTATRNSDEVRNPRPLLSRAYIERHRRRRFVLAAAELAHDQGTAAVTAGKISRRARSSKMTFYDLFGSAEDCLSYGVEEAHELLLAPIREAGHEREWLLEVEDAIAGFATAVATEPLLSELLLVHSFGIESPRAERGYEASVDELCALFARGREAAALLGLGDAPPLAEEFLARMVISSASLGLMRPGGPQTPSQRREIVFMIGNTYLGLEETGRLLGPLDAGPGVSPN